MTAPEALPSHSTSEQPHVLDVCSHLRELRDMPPVRRVRTPTGEMAWLVTGYAEVKALFADSRIKRAHPLTPTDLPTYVKEPTADLMSDEMQAVADENHGLSRSPLRQQFAARHMKTLQPRIAAIVDELLTAVTDLGPPVDLHAEFSVPLVIESFAELFGVPAEDRAMWRGAMSDAEEMSKAIPEYVWNLIIQKKENPGDDMVSRLCAAGTPEAWTMGLPFAGFGATIRQIDYGILQLTQNPEQRDAVKDPARLPKAAEEMLRVSGAHCLPRYARDDIDIAGVVIQTNDLVLLDLTLANLDDQAFEHPEHFDITRSPNRHMSFAYGAASCLGAPFARLVIHTAFSKLFTQLPTVRPAVPMKDLRKSSDVRLMGLAELPVTW
jgi:cytochrome P450 monooxygenase